MLLVYCQIQALNFNRNSLYLPLLRVSSSSDPLLDGVYRPLFLCKLWFFVGLRTTNSSIWICWKMYHCPKMFILQGSRRMNYKNLMKDCLSILCELYHVHTGISNDHEYLENSIVKPSEDCNTALAFAFLEVGKSTCIAMQKLLITVSYWFLQLSNF